MTHEESEKLTVGDAVVFSDGIGGRVIETGSITVKIDWLDGHRGIIHHGDMKNVSRATAPAQPSAPDRIDYDKTGDMDDVVLIGVTMFRMERIDKGGIWIRCYRDGKPDVVFHLASAQKINVRHEFD